MTVQDLDARGTPPRYGQLTYTSFDVVTMGQPVAGGWQVKEVRGGLSREEAEHLRGEVATQLHGARGLPAFPTPEEVAALPRRLVYAPAPGGAAAYWHTAPAGVDASGRPGNVFAHVLLDRRPALATDWRPVELWRSPDWLTPYNADQVRAATIPAAEHPRPGRAVSRESVVDFLLDPECWRVGLLAVLLDAVAEALAGGRRVVLGVDDGDAAAQWVGAVSFLMSTGASRAFHFSTLERAPLVQRAWDQGVHLACLPHGELEVLAPSHDVVRLGSREDVDLGALGGRDHVTAAGDRVAVSPWSVLALASFQDDDVARRALLAVDQFAADVGDRGLRYEWPLAMAALWIPELTEDVKAEAGLVLSRSTPDALRDELDLGRALDAVEALVGDDPARAWECVAPARGDGRTPLQRLVLRAYVARALGDPRWLLRDGGVPLPADAASLDYPEALALACRTLDGVRSLVGSTRGPARRELAALVLRVVDVLWRLGLVGPGTEHGDDARLATGDLVRDVVVDLLLDADELSLLLRDVIPVEGAAVAWLSRAAVAVRLTDERSGPSPAAGTRVPARAYPLLGWARDWSSASLDSMIHDCREVDPLDEEFAIQVATGGLTDAEAWPAHARLGAVVLLHRATDGSTSPVGEDALERVGLDAGELALLVDAFGAAVPAGVLARALAAAPSDPGLDALCDVLERHGAYAAQAVGGEEQLDALVSLRRLIVRFGHVGRAAELSAVAYGIVVAADGAWGAGVAVTPSNEVAACLDTALVVVAALERADGLVGEAPRWREVLERPLPAALSLRERVRLRTWVDAGLISVDTVASATIRSSPQFPARDLVTPRLAAVSLLRSPERQSDSFLDGLMRDLLRDLSDDHSRLAARVADGVADDLSHAAGLSGAVDDLHRRSERFAEATLRHLSPKGSGRLGGAFSRFRWP